ncbi:MAG: pentapeptide repeat-containing protein [Caldilineaceae bacterium]
MNKANQPQPPRLPKRLPLPASEEAVLSDFAEFTTVLLERPEFYAQRAVQVTFNGVHCKQGRWADSKVQGLRCIDTRFDACDLANATWEQFYAQRVAFTGCQLVGLTTLEAYLHNVRFAECNGQFAAFRFAICKGVRFDHCDLRHADFQGADLTGVVFHKCDLSHAQFSGTTLKGTDLRGAKIDDLHVGIPELPGAIVDPLQAAYLAGLLGVVIKDEHDET